MIVKLMIKNYVLIKKLYYNFFLSLSNRLQKTVKLFLFLLCFSAGFNLPKNSKIGIEFFPAAFSEEVNTNKEQAAKAVWKIDLKNHTGSGFFISENKIVTNFHVIEELESIGSEDIVLVQEGNPNQLKVKRISALSILNDLAILEIEGAVSDFLSLPAKEDLNAFKNLYTFGYSGGRFQEIKQMGVFKDDSFFVDRFGMGGASGSPVLNESHQLIGVASAIDVNFLSFINVQTLKSFIELEHCKNLNVKECFRLSRERFKKSIQEVKGARDFFKIANVFYMGIGMETDFFKARYWLEKSAEQGDAAAQFKLAVMYHEGIGGERNLFKARYWLEKSAEQDHAPAQFILSTEYYDKEDKDKIIELLEKSANQGYMLAQEKLSKKYLYGVGGVEQNVVKAEKWFEKVKQVYVRPNERLEKAVEQDHVQAKKDLDNMIYEKKEDLIEERKSLLKLALQGNLQAKNQLGLMHYLGIGGDKNVNIGRKWMKEAAKQGDASAQYLLGLMYLNEEGKDISEAIKWLEKAAEQGHVKAKEYLDAIMAHEKRKKGSIQANEACSSNLFQN